MSSAADTKRKILVVDDEPALTRMASYIFGRVYDVTCANSLAEGLRAIAACDFDAALVDDRMPDGRGPELLLKLGDKTPDCLRYLVTANLGIVDEFGARFFEGISVTYKPVDLRDFLSRLAADLESRARRPPPPGQL